ncbi:MAG: hypothetical protein GF320_11950 [Armatimonadia bacterium]|nr:hypothetical protein [Armatimonadia bacterium]
MRWLVAVVAALVMTAWMTSCCCRSIQQGFQQGVQQAQAEAEVAGDTAPSDASGAGEDSSAADTGADEGATDGADTAEPRLVDITVGDAINPETNEIISVTDVFWPSDPTMHLAALVVDAEGGTVVTAELIAAAVEAEDGSIVTNEPLMSLDVVVDEDVERFTAFFDFGAPDQGWWLGEYECDFYLDGEYETTTEMVVVLPE